MFAYFRYRLLTLAVVLWGAIGRADAASANWITIKNDTGKAIVVQETVVVNGEVRRGKVTNLLAGETLREFSPGPTVKRIEVFDARNPNQATWSGNLNCRDENQGFVVNVAGGKVRVEPVKSKK